jgi:hypothetical protein
MASPRSAETWHLLVEEAARCESGSGQPLIGLPHRVAGASGTSPALATRRLREQMTKDTVLREEDC